MDEGGTLIEKSAGAGHRAVSLHRDCVLVQLVVNIMNHISNPLGDKYINMIGFYVQCSGCRIKMFRTISRSGGIYEN